MPKRPKLYYVEWLDHWTHKGWKSVQEYEDEGWLVDEICKTTGWLLKETKTGLLIGNTLNGNGNPCQTMFILKNCITKKKVLNV